MQIADVVGEEVRVTENAQRLYLRKERELLAFVVAHRLGPLRASEPAKVDDAVMQYTKQVYMAGISADTGEKLKTAREALRPECSKHSPMRLPAARASDARVQRGGAVPQRLALARRVLARHPRRAPAPRRRGARVDIRDAVLHIHAPGGGREGRVGDFIAPAMRKRKVSAKDDGAGART